PEQPFAAEEDRLDAADDLDVVVDAGCERDDAAGVDAQQLAGSEGPLEDRAAGVQEAPAVALQALHDEALAAEEPDAQPLLDRDAEADALGGAEECVLLRDQLAAYGSQVDRDDLSGIRSRERKPLLARRLV